MNVLYESANGVATATLNRPESLNAVTDELVDDLCAAFRRGIDESVGALILAGAGRSFCAGHDLKHEDSPTVEQRRRRVERIQDVTRLIRAAPFPVVAVVQGYALGAGCEFALTCDLIVAADDAQFGFPEVAVGLSITGGISHILPMAIGYARAKELVLLGERFTAEAAYKMGLINRVVAGGDLSSTGHDLGVALAARPRTAAHYAKRVLDSGPQRDLDSAMHLESIYAINSLGSEDAHKSRADFRIGESVNSTRSSATSV